MNDNTNWDSVKSDRDRLLEADIAVIDGKQIREFNNCLGLVRLIQSDSFIRCRLIEVQMYILYLVLTSQSHSRVTTGRLQQQHKFDSAVRK